MVRSESGLTWEPIEPSQDDLAFMDYQNWLAQRIAHAYRVPPELLGTDVRTDLLIDDLIEGRMNTETIEESPIGAEPEAPAPGQVEPEEKPAPAKKKKEKPNHAARRVIRLLMRRASAKMARRNRTATTCANCGLAFIAPAAIRCQCKVARPRRAEVA